MSKSAQLPKPLKVPSFARSVPKPLKVSSLARSVPKPLKVPSLARSVPKPLFFVPRASFPHTSPPTSYTLWRASEASLVVGSECGTTPPSQL